MKRHLTKEGYFLKVLRTATYTTKEGQIIEVGYDSEDLCWMCGKPVGWASMSGTVVCPTCDCGKNRDGSPWTFRETEEAAKNFRHNHKLAFNRISLSMSRLPKRKRISPLAKP